MDPNFVLSNGDRALHHAARLGLLEVVQWLVRSGAQINLPNYSGETALDVAHHNKRTKVVRFLEKVYVYVSLFVK